ncbi:bile acid:sodium symporter [Saccharopolyspora erythraea]|nr:bile acid:sodium symporter family protein [Saccharopolyspora erythraea]QRK90726.1 bile acid:sodium symporter [Saccharopolyspora erythraea]
MNSARTRKGNPLGNIPALFARIRVDPYVLAILAAAGTAAFLPVHGIAAAGLDRAITVAIALLFFVYGARLSAKEALDGARNWRLHLLILGITFVLFPLFGLLCGLLVPTVLTPELYVGMAFLCALPSTVQSSITFTSLARGNVAAAICASTFSNVLGVLLAPLLVSMLVTTSGGALSTDAVRDIVLLLLVPFVLGQLSRRWVGKWVRLHKRGLGLLERGVILMAVYAAFSTGTVSGIWHQLTLSRIGMLLLVDAALLASVLALSSLLARSMGFGRADQVPIVFCGSQKSLATGLPMATVLLAGQGVGLGVLPLMLYHQMQLITCAWLARRFAERERTEVPQPKQLRA